MTTVGKAPRRSVALATAALLASSSIIFSPAPEAHAVDPTVVETRVGSSSDDAEESDTGSMSSTSSDLELTVDGTSGEQTVGIRLAEVDVPRGARIDEAYLQFQADESGTDPTSLTIAAQAIDGAPSFGGGDFDISSRALTTALVTWSPPSWGLVGEAGLDQRTPSLAAVVQEVVDRPGWASGNSMVLIMTGSGKRVAEAFDGEPAGAPLLHVEYSIAVSVEAIDDVAVEGSVPIDEGIFRFTRAGPTDQTITVSYSIGGSATPVGDYVALSGTVTLPAGAQSADVVVTPVDDGLIEGTENVAVTVVDGVDYVAGSGANASISVIDDDTPTVFVTATDAIAVEGANPANYGELTFTRTGPTDQSLSVGYLPGGDATPDSDYTALPGSLTMLAGESTRAITISPIDDSSSESAEAVSVTVVDGAGYVAVSPISAVVMIVDDDPTLDIRVTASEDDAEEDAAGNVSLSSSDLEMVFDPGRGDQVVGVRFAAVDVPAGATVTEAWLQFQVDEVSLGTTTLTVEGHATDDAASFTSNAFDISSRTRTTASVPWSPEPWDVTRVAGPDQQTPDLTLVVQEIINRPGWVASNSLAFIITGSGQRVANSYDGDTLAAPVLHIEHMGSGSPANQAPTVRTSADSVVFPAAATLDGTVSDDLLPDPPGTVNVVWSQLSGPGIVTFANASVVHTTATFSIPGVYELQLTADDGELTGNDTVLLSAVDPNQPAVENVRFAAVGDYGVGCCGELEVSLLVETQNPDFLITVGDNRYINDIDQAVGQFFSDYIGNYQGEYGSGSPINRFFPALGNHDYSEFGGSAVYHDYFSLPGGAIPSSGTSGNERYYDFIQGPVHFFVLNGNSEPDGRSSTSVQAQWLQTQLAASTSPWQIVYMHQPPYSSASHGPTLEMQWPFEAWGADAVLAGHDHDYERLAKGGIPYMVVGSGGATLYGQSNQPDPDSQFFYNADYGALIVDACSERLAFEFHSVSEGVVDSYTVGATSCSGGPANNPPVASDDVVVTLEDTAVIVDVVANDTDPDANLDPVSVNTTCVGCAGPVDGGLTNNGDGTFVYTPNPDFNGSDGFVYEVCDTLGLCDTATVTVTVTAVNDPPVASDDVAVTLEDTAVTVDVVANDSDVDGDALVVTNLGSPANGVVVDNGDGTVTYTPDPGFVGSDTFTYTANDATADSNTATVTVTVTAVNDPPVASDDVVVTLEDTAVIVDVVANDTDPDANLDPVSVNTTCVGCAGPVDGGLTNNGDGTFVYTPNPDFNGSDGFVYEVCDTLGLCDTATVTVTVTAVNDPPVASDDVAVTLEDTAVTVDVVANDSDVDGDALVVTNLGSPANGVVVDNGDGTVTYTPDPGFVGSDTFTYTANDATADSNTATVTVTVTAVAPQVVEVRVASGSDDAEERDTGRVSLTSSDLELVVDQNRGAQTVGLRFVGVNVPAGAVITSAWVQFQADESGSVVTDLLVQGQAADNPTTFVNVSGDISLRARTVAQVGWSPLAWTTVGEAGPDQQTSELAAIIQEIVDRGGWTDGNAMVIIITGTGTRTAESYNSNSAAAPLLHIEYSAEPVANRAPVAIDDVTVTPVDNPVTIDVVANDGDPDSNLEPASANTTCVGCSGASNGWLANLGTGSFTYTPDPGFVGGDWFVYEVCDTSGLCDTATVTVTVTAVAPQVVEVRVASGSDDAEERDTGRVSLTSSDLELVVDQNRGAQTVGLRFVGVNVPAGAVITSAWVQFQADESGSVVTDLLVQGQAADNPTTFVNVSGDISLRARTVAQVGWSPLAWTTVGEAGPDQQTSELAAIIQEIVDRGGWTDGNAMVIIITGTGTRTAESYNSNSAAAPLLHIEYSVP